MVSQHPAFDTSPATSFHWLLHGPCGRLIAHVPAKDDYNQCERTMHTTLRRPTYGWITAHLVLCNRSRFAFYRRFQGSSARNRVKRCIVFQSAGHRVGVNNEYHVCTCISISHSTILSSDSQYQDGLQQILQGHKPDI
ncbi:hypothetical protein P692DRAFT_20471948 [Suillus brevipes Sb2]|nr:hypothetical protein P692DRAFT_20471948 [Suillus brevipes Sb2]